MTKETILVTGATGNVGSVLVEKLLALDNFNVRAAVHSVSKAKSLQELGAQVVEMDFNSLESVTTALTGVDKVFFLTPAVPNFDKFTQTVCDAAVQVGTVKQIVRQSVIGASKDSPLILSQMHFQSEKLIEATGIPYTFIRPTAFAQQLTGIFPWVYRQGESSFYLPIGEAKVAWLDARDIATLAAEVLTNPEPHQGKAYHLTGSTPVSGSEAADKISFVTGKTITYVDEPIEAYQKRMAQVGANEMTIGQMSIIYGDMKEGWLGTVINDFEEVMGKPATPFAQFVSDYAQVWQ